MRVRFLRWGLLSLALAILFLAGDVLAAELNWGIGGFGGLNVPYRQMKERFSSAKKYGASLNYVMSRTATLEIEYHHSKFDNGKLETKPFVWAVNKKTYTNTKAVSRMVWNSLAVNAMVFPGERNKDRGFKAKEYRYYLLVGGGFYRYKNSLSNMIYPGQTKGITDPVTKVQEIDPNVVMDPQVDQRYTLAANVGVGLEGFLTDNISVDVRGRYNLVIGQLRPMLFYKINEAWPIMLFDVGVGLKFYFLK